jgi:hypothetical protein
VKNTADDVLAAPVVGVRFAGIDNLEMSGVLCDLTQAIQVRKNQVGALVPCRATCKTDGENLFVETKAGFFAHGFQQFVFGDEMGRPDFLGRQSERAAKAVVVFAPLRDLAVKELLKRRRSPSSRVHAVGDGLDRNFGKHLAGGDAVLFGDAVDVGAETKRQVRHVEMCAAGGSFLQIRIVLLGLQRALHKIGNRGILQIEEFALLRENASEVFDGKAIVTGGNRRVRGEHTLGADFFDVIAIDSRAARFSGFRAEQFERE